MQKYRIRHNPTGEVVEEVTNNLALAIKNHGWEAKDCYCEILAIPPQKPQTTTRAPSRNAKQKGQTTAEHRRAARAQEEMEERAQKKREQEPKPVEGSKEVADLAQDAQKSVELAQRVERDIDEAIAGGQDLVDTIEKEILSTKPGVVGEEPTEAEKAALEHKVKIEALAISAEVVFLEMGRLLYQARENGEWSILHYEDFKAYIEDLSLPMTNSYSWATRLIGIFQYMVIEAKLDVKLLAEIGVAKLTRLLPIARKGELTEELIEAARKLSDLDLREELGHHVGAGATEDMVICPRCGETFDAKKAARANEAET